MKTYNIHAVHVLNTSSCNSDINSMQWIGGSQEIVDFSDVLSTDVINTQNQVCCFKRVNVLHHIKHCKVNICVLFSCILFSFCVQKLKYP